MSNLYEDHRLAQHLKEVALDCLKPFDTLLIQTEHSLYIFSVGETTRRGTLSGGVLGAQPVHAMIAAPKGELGSRLKRSKITTGDRIEFFFKSGLKFLSVTTSVVTKLSRIPRQTSLAQS